MATGLRPSFSIPDFFKEILIILLQNCDVVCIYPPDLYLFLPGPVGGARRRREMGIPFAKTTELQYGFSMKCPSCPTICQQNGETSIQPAGFYIQREKRQAKIKNFRTLFSAEKFMLLAIQQNKDLINLQHPVGNNASK
ncbi:hypothetical protein J4733_24630 [Klebsiella pneumoniae]|uniref:Uncharacterized protein n=1 Tax=Klebsiella pneumoniae TaxID=573 RepID=A0A939NN57_KLEPN|nr:hypothetical protein [Klebsiella pneumoniae]